MKVKICISLVLSLNSLLVFVVCIPFDDEPSLLELISDFCVSPSVVLAFGISVGVSDSDIEQYRCVRNQQDDDESDQRPPHAIPLVQIVDPFSKDKEMVARKQYDYLVHCLLIVLQHDIERQNVSRVAHDK